MSDSCKENERTQLIYFILTSGIPQNNSVGMITLRSVHNDRESVKHILTPIELFVLVFCYNNLLLSCKYCNCMHHNLHYQIK